MNNTTRKRQNGVFVCGLASDVSQMDTVLTPQGIVKEFLDCYGSVVPFKTMLQELLLNYMTSPFMSVDVEARESFVADYRCLYSLLCNIEVFSLHNELDEC